MSHPPTLSSHARPGERWDYQTKLQLGLRRLSDAGESDALLGAALLAIHGALEDFLRDWLASNQGLPEEIRTKVEKPRECHWPCLIDLARRHIGLSAEEAGRLHNTNGRRAGFAHGGDLGWRRAQADSYALFVQRLITSNQPQGLVLRDRPPGPSAGEIEIYVWEEELIEALEGEGWRQVTAYDVPPHFVRLVRHEGDERVDRLVAYIESLRGFEVRPRSAPYGHVGATLTDVVLQARWNYRRAVRPRIKQILAALDGKPTTRDFLSLLEGKGAERALRVRGGKATIALSLARLLDAEGVQTEEQLREWAMRPESREKLMAIKGVGPKTADYLALRAGLRDAVAVDIHVRTFLDQAGIAAAGYDDAAAVIAHAAKILGHAPADLDGSIWRYQSWHR